LTIESVAEGIATTDLDGRITDANDSKVLLHGFANKRELIGKNSLDLIAEQDRGKAKEAMKKTLETGRSGSSEYTMLKKDATRFFGERSAALLKDPDGKAVGLVISTKDVSVRRRAEETLKASEAKFRNLVENAAIGILTTFSNGSIIGANKTAVQIFGFGSSEELASQSVLARYVDPRDRQRLLEFVDLTGVAKGFEVRMKHKDGSPFWASLNVITQMTQSGERQFLSIIEDITERKLAADELSRLNKELKSFNSRLEAKVEERTHQLEDAVSVANESNRAKSEFLASMSHELRTPLNAIIGFSQVLHEQYFGSLNEKQTEYMTDILESGKHLLALINDILDLSKVEAGKMELEKSNVNIRDLVNNSLMMIKEKAQIHRIGLEVKVSESLEGTKILADERRLKQVIFNLLSNSAKFTPDGGKIRVEAKTEGKNLIICVSDTGIGISPEEQKKLFTAFYQASGGIKDKTPGTGLGLSITRSIIEKHGGRIWLESEGKGKGSSFYFTLPLGVEAEILESAR
jgi:PAS domain S-box-containing protein